MSLVSPELPRFALCAIIDTQGYYQKHWGDKMPKFVECNGGCGRKLYEKEKWCDLRSGLTVKNSQGADVFIDDALNDLCKTCHERFNRMNDEQIADYIQAGGGWGNTPDGVIWLNPKPPTPTPSKGTEMRTKDYVTEDSVWYAEATPDGWTVFQVKDGVIHKLKDCSTPQRARQYIRKHVGSKIQEAEPRGEVLQSGPATILQFRPRGLYTG